MSDLSEEEVEVVEETLQRVASDLSMIADRTLDLSSIKVKRATKRAIGRDRIHISFKLGIKTEKGNFHGCILVPLPDAISLACYLMMVPDDGVLSKRSDQTLDSTTKDAMLEVGNFIGGAADAAFRSLGLSNSVKVNSEGCQGVKAGVRPALVYREGDPLLVGRGKAKLHEFQSFEIILMLPDVIGLLKEPA